MRILFSSTRALRERGHEILGAGPADLAGMRALLRATQTLRRFEPSGSAAAWDAAARRIWE